ncbi:MAG: signal recognition particle protein [Rickettsiaceae bacterium]|nr:signal recognition particle protein [Rickettsiaceae bacterium]
MFANLSKGLSSIFQRLKNRGTITEKDLDQTLSEVRKALIEADVALEVIKNFINNIREKAIGQEVVKSISPGQMIIKIIHDELIELLQGKDEETGLNLKSAPPVNILMSGLQGSGKTTTTSKLAYYLKNQKKHILLVSLDIYRPAAKEQLEILAQNLQVDSLPIISNEAISETLARAHNASKKGNYDVVIYDTAGRLNIDEELILELKYIKDYVKPSEVLLVVDSLMGQDAANIAKDFNEAVQITGIILTRIDGDGRGGAALSVKSLTGAPIKFMGTGEKSDQLEIFDAKRVASRILDMGDVVSLVEKAIEVTESAEAERLAKRMEAGKFDFNDYKTQLSSIEKMGGISSMIGMIPGMSALKDKINSDRLSDKPIKRQIAIINSMTKQERRRPDLLNASRKKRVAFGSGTTVSDVNKLIKQYEQIFAMLKKMRNMDPKTLMRSLKGLV